MTFRNSEGAVFGNRQNLPIFGFCKPKIQKSSVGTIYKV